MGDVVAGSEVCVDVTDVTDVTDTDGADVTGLLCIVSTVSLLAPDDEATVGSHLWDRRLTCSNYIICYMNTGLPDSCCNSCLEFS